MKQSVYRSAAVALLGWLLASSATAQTLPAPVAVTDADTDGAAPLQALVRVRADEVAPDDVLLFRYSALTFNGHRIHYDRKYVTQVEGYPGLIVHGPLIATLLVDLVRRHAPSAFIRRFDFKAVRPTFDLHPFRLNAQPSEDGKTVRVWAQDHTGWLTMQGTVELA